ncbi:hypothetical protein I302_101507 [Kwoniella bestiolae CBS 10118]|uniref:Tyrosine specific protein phosphatases domain-containing protein n=1 Tax=Kwoniella bestiolae CBS 10118 TaxID=1296100 RepID=A0A1B9GCF0_9TREE|nr:hypothetical protein I302_00191 [Kwoniella bestiolae CBS 10118]OCF28702.1 hypothetical protein I302_00191 [Kwoniella bestiolae CBS 10118]
MADIIPETFPHNPSADFLDHLIHTLHLLQDYPTAQTYCGRLILVENQGESRLSRGYIRLGDTAFQLEKYKLAMLSYARAYENARKNDEERITKYCLKRLERCSAHTEWGNVLLEEELDQVPNALSQMLLEPWSTELRSTIGEMQLSPSLCLESRQRMYTPHQGDLYKLPRFFKWIIPFSFAAMSTPRNEQDISALSSIGIKTIITLTEETPLPAQWFNHKSIKNIFIPIPNYYPPSIEQIDIIIQLLNDESNLPVLVHCGGGKGRAGTAIACYLASYGFNRPTGDRSHPFMSASEAISKLRSIRPGSLETTQQENFVSKWCSTVWKRQSIFPDRPSEPAPCRLMIEGSIGEESNLFILVGLPGSGKSWFSNALLARNPKGWKRISQDESGSRRMCETGISRAPSNTKQKVLLDRCNTSSKDRREWLKLSSNWVKDPICIWFDYDKNLCTSRAQRRIGHPTIQPGNRVRNAVEQMDRIFDRPTLEEGFRALCIIRSFEAALELVERLSPRIGIYKFPRTPHLIDLGAATCDDLIEKVPAFNVEQTNLGDTPPNSRREDKVIITEKIDEANMGFSLSSDRTKIIVQNRSHYINPTSHEQFKKLGHWLETHLDGLKKLLGQDEYFAERYILFGEWMYATHSIHYTLLPDLFIAFDLCDRSTDAFLDRRTLQSLLNQYGCGIPLVPVMEEVDQCPTEKELWEMVQRKSQFWDGRVEGIYVKWESDGVVRRRGKVVRSDFIAGNEHWMKRRLEVNELAKIAT